MGRAFQNLPILNQLSTLLGPTVAYRNRWFYVVPKTNDYNEKRGHFYNVLNSPLGLLKNVFQIGKDLTGLGFQISLDN